MHVLPIYYGQVAFASTLALKIRRTSHPDPAESGSPAEVSTKTRYRRRPELLAPLTTGSRKGSTKMQTKSISFSLTLRPVSRGFDGSGSKSSWPSRIASTSIFRIWMLTHRYRTRCHRLCVSCTESPALLTNQSRRVGKRHLSCSQGTRLFLPSHISVAS